MWAILSMAQACTICVYFQGQKRLLNSSIELVEVARLEYIRWVSNPLPRVLLCRYGFPLIRGVHCSFFSLAWLLLHSIMFCFFLHLHQSLSTTHSRVCLWFRCLLFFSVTCFCSSEIINARLSFSLLLQSELWGLKFEFPAAAAFTFRTSPPAPDAGGSRSRELRRSRHRPPYHWENLKSKKRGQLRNMSSVNRTSCNLQQFLRTAR